MIYNVIGVNLTSVSVTQIELGNHSFIQLPILYLFIAVCTLRLDFEEFSIASWAAAAGGAVQTDTDFTCATDTFVVSNVSNDLKFFSCHMAMPPIFAYF